jgi:osmotically-inducible protein OsmY
LAGGHGSASRTDCLLRLCTRHRIRAENPWPPEQASLPASAANRVIHDAILAEFVRQRWAPTNGIRVYVDEGCVTLEGAIFDNRDREAMLVVARNVLGVKAVRDELTWIEPMSGTALGPTF